MQRRLSSPLRRRRRKRRSASARRDRVGGARRGLQRIVLIRAIAQIPAFVRLLLGLMGDRRVALADKLMVAGAIAYFAMPADLIVDYIPFFGLIDDVFILGTTIRRLLRNAGFRVALKYWQGEPRELRRLRIEEIIVAAAAFLPRRVRRRLEKRA